VERGITRDNNVLAFDEIGLIPRIASLGDVHDQSTEVMGQKLSLPVITAPVAAHGVCSAGELAVAKATKAAQTALCLSNFSACAIEDIVAENPATFFQMYWYGTRDDIEASVERARRANAKGIVVTLDWALTYRNDWGAPTTNIPARLDLKTAMKFAPAAITHPSWAFDFVRNGLPRFTAPNAAKEGEVAPPFVSLFPTIFATKQPTWRDIGWLREIWGGPFMVKGIMHRDDALRAVDIGATAISVSNHGGNNIDSTPAAIRALPAIAEAVGHQLEVLFDGGIRRGSDVVKALALGARAVLIGRAHLFALAAGGDAGVYQILQILRAGIQETLLALGRSSVRELAPSDVLLPEGFAIKKFPPSLAQDVHR
jgi:pre-mycofactocin synthase